MRASGGHVSLPGRWALAGAALAAAACATPRTQCPLGTSLARRIYSGGAEAEWCRRPDGVRHGPETRYFESGAELASGEYVDGALGGVWRYRFTNGRNWRADRWDDGALTAKTVDPNVAQMSPAELDKLGVTSSGIIKLASNDPLLARDRPVAPFAGMHPNGRIRVAGSYDADGLRTGVWRFWFEDGRPDREIEYLAGVRERGARAWHPSGAPATEGGYMAGEREGIWRWWDAQGRYLGEATYQGGKRVSVRAVSAVGGGMLPP
jgi:antitoxin component YwqK of YwqJK toxin-antitoxin module